MSYKYMKISVIVIIFAMISTIFVACKTNGNIENETVLTGKITAIYEDRLSLDIIIGSDLVSDKTTLTINSNTKFEKGVLSDYQIGDLLTFTITGEVMESYPTQTKASRIISCEPDQEIVLDIRETISGLFDGQFPEMVITLNQSVDEAVAISKGSFFVIEIGENPSTGYRWKLKENSDIEVVGDDFVSDANKDNLLGVGGNRYFGIRINQTGDITLTFELYSPSGDITETRTAKISIN